MKEAISKAETDMVWRDCKPGELVELATHQRQRVERRAVLRGLSAVAAGCVAVGIAGTFWSRAHGPSALPGGIACDEVTRLLPAYVARQLDAKRTAQVQKHLAGCEHCTETLKKLQHDSAGNEARLTQQPRARG